MPEEVWNLKPISSSVYKHLWQKLQTGTDRVNVNKIRRYLDTASTIVNLNMYVSSILQNKSGYLT
jgi:hypothetical protein